MSNYQLARTNTYIGGQMKLDLTLNRGSDELYIEDFHMSPVSNYTGYAWGTDSELLNNRHSENISDYYAKTKNFFFEDCLNPALDTKYPLYSPNYPIDTHDNDCLMGLYRLDRKTYGKSYGFFCPFWITEPDKFLETRFVFKVFKYTNINPVDDAVYTYTEEEWTAIFKEAYPDESDEQIAQRVAYKLQELIDNPIKTPVCRTSLNMHEIADRAFHNKFVNYFNEYMQGFAAHKYDIKESKFKTTNVTSDAYRLNFEDHEITQKKTKIEETKALPFLSSDLAYISLKNNQAWVKGIDPQTGAYSNKDISYICNTLLERERPLMDNDYYLARIFKDNSIIAQQLVNFNFIFDFADIVPANIYEEMQYTRFGIEVYMYQQERVENGNYKDNDGEAYTMKRLPLKDFYSNYEYIPMSYIHDQNNTVTVGDDITLHTDLYIDYESGEDSVINRNVLDYKNNADFIEYVYKNKLLQNTIHWGIENSQYIFNLYDGFSPTIVRTENDEVICTESSRNMPFTANISLKSLDIGDQNILWANYYTQFNNSMVVLENFKSVYTHYNINDEWINGVKYDFSNIDYNTILDKIKTYIIPTNDSIVSISGPVTNSTTHVTNITTDYIEKLMNEKIFIVLNRNDNVEDINIDIVNWESYNLVIFNAKRDNLTFQAIRDKISNILRFCTPQVASNIQRTERKVIKLGKVPDNKKLTKKITPKTVKRQFEIRELTLNIDLINAENDSNDDTSQQERDFTLLYVIYYMMNRAIPQTAISFNKSYTSKVADSPAAESVEVIYKQPNKNLLRATQQIIYRYDGNIQPLFITVPRKEEYEEPAEIGETHLVNYSNFVVQYEESLESIPQYNNENSAYQPDYPSIGYSSLASETIDYDLPGFIQYYGDSSANIYCGERRWYDGSFMYFLPQAITLIEHSKQLSNDAVYNAFVKEVLMRMRIDVEDNEDLFKYYARIIMNYILPLYTMKFTYEKLYEEGTNVPVIEDDSFIYTYTITFELI